MDVKIRIFDEKEKEKVCGKPELLHRTNLESLYTSCTRRFNMKTGVTNKKTGTKILS